MDKCRFCAESIPEGVKRCKHCGEPQGWARYFWGMILKYIPVLSACSVFVALASLCLAYIENRAARQAEAQRAITQTQLHQKTLQLQAVEWGAGRAISRLQAKLPESAKDDLLQSLEFPPNTTRGTLERAVNTAPGDASRREQLFLYRALKDSNQP